MPDHWSFIAASRLAVPSQAVMCVSWPQPCMTPVSTPERATAPDLGREGQAGLLDDRQAVHVGADQQHRPGPVLHHRDNAGLADLLGHREAELARLGGELGRRAHLLHRQLGVGVQVLIDRHQRRHVARDRVGQSRRRGGRGEQGAAASSRAAGHRRFPQLAGTSSITSSVDSKARPRHDHPPAGGPDALDEGGDVAVRVMAILHGPGLVAEHQRAEEHLAQRVAGEDQPDRPLRPGQLGEALQVALLLDAAGEGRDRRHSRACPAILAPTLITRQR